MSKPPPIVALIVQTPLCLDCLEDKTGIPAAEGEDVIQRIRAAVDVTVSTGHCNGCLRTTTTYFLGASPRPPMARAASVGLTLRRALWEYLTQHRGEMYCTSCLAASLGATSRLDRAVFAAEGRGARRLYGRCPSCDKERLLCGLTA
jgi:transposase